MTSLSQWPPDCDPAEGNDHHAGNHQGHRQGLHDPAPSDRDARSDDSEQRADPGHMPGQKRMMSVLNSNNAWFPLRSLGGKTRHADRGLGEHSPGDRAHRPGYLSPQGTSTPGQQCSTGESGRCTIHDGVPSRAVINDASSRP